MRVTRAFFPLAACLLLFVGCASNPEVGDSASTGSSSAKAQPELEEAPGAVALKAAVAKEGGTIAFHSEATREHSESMFKLLDGIVRFYYEKLGWKQVRPSKATHGVPYCNVFVAYDKNGDLEGFRIQKYAKGESPAPRVIERPEKGYDHLIKLHQMCVGET